MAIIWRNSTVPKIPTWFAIFSISSAVNLLHYCAITWILISWVKTTLQKLCEKTIDMVPEWTHLPMDWCVKTLGMPISSKLHFDYFILNFTISIYHTSSARGSCILSSCLYLFIDVCYVVKGSNWTGRSDGESTYFHISSHFQIILGLYWIQLYN